MFWPQIYKRDPRPCTPPNVMTSSAMGFKLGVFGFLPTTHAKINASTICVHRAAFTLMQVTYASDKPQLF